MSRRAAEAEIAAGRVTVNGKVAELGKKIDPSKDKIEIAFPQHRRGRCPYRAWCARLTVCFGYVQIEDRTPRAGMDIGLYGTKSVSKKIYI